MCLTHMSMCFSYYKLRNICPFTRFQPQNMQAVYMFFSHIWVFSRRSLESTTLLKLRGLTTTGRVYFFSLSKTHPVSVYLPLAQTNTCIHKPIYFGNKIFMKHTLINSEAEPHDTHTKTHSFILHRTEIKGLKVGVQGISSTVLLQKAQPSTFCYAQSNR